jgi:hypothetical protein
MSDDTARQRSFVGSPHLIRRADTPQWQSHEDLARVRVSDDELKRLLNPVTDADLAQVRMSDEDLACIFGRYDELRS